MRGGAVFARRRETGIVQPLAVGDGSAQPVSLALSAPATTFGGRRLAAGGPTASVANAAVGETAIAGYNSATPWIAIVLLGLFAARISELFPAIAPLCPTLIVALAGSAWVLAHSGARNSAHALSSPVLRAMIVYGAWAVLAAPFAIWPKHALLSAIPIFAPAILLCMILLLTAPTSRNLDLITFGFVCAVLVQLLGTMATGIIYRGGRLSGTDSLDPNDLASLAALTIPFAVAHAQRRRGIARLVALATVIIGVNVLMKTGSRGGTIAFAVWALVYVAGQPGYKRWVFGALFAVGMGVAWLVGPPEYRTRMRTMTDLDEDYNETAYEGRNQIRQRAKEYFLADPVFGVGFANFEAAEGRRLRETYRRGKWSAPHNAYWQALAELGAVGGAAFFAMLLFAGRAAWRVWRPRLPNGRPNPLHRPELLAALLAFAAAAYFLSHAYFWTMFGLVGMIAFADRIADRAFAGADVPQAAPADVSPRRAGARSRRAGHR